MPRVVIAESVASESEKISKNLDSKFELFRGIFPDFLGYTCTKQMSQGKINFL